MLFCRIIPMACALVLLSGVLDVRLAGQSCPPCMPPEGTWTKFFTYTFASHESELGSYFETARIAWNNLLATTTDRRLQKVSSGGNVQVSISPGVCPARGEYRVEPDGSAWLKICPTTMAEPTEFIQRVISHELGHMLGLDESSCLKENTVMLAIAPFEMSGAATLPGCADHSAVHEYHDCWPPISGCPAGWTWSSTLCSCVSSPILLTFESNAFDLTSIAGGVDFDLDGDGTRERVSWTAAGSDDAFLWMDRDGDGVVDGGHELFGNVTPMSWTTSGPWGSHGFEALGWFDRTANGGTADGWIDSGDLVFERLRLWRDSNHDGVSQPAEILTLSAARVERISLAIVESSRSDKDGNLFRYKVKVELLNEHGGRVNRSAYDVYLGKR
jgi:hypothetical protein